MCTEGTRSCRGGVWSACENTHEYLAPAGADTQRIIDPGGSAPNCSICDLRCFKAIDNLLSDGGAGDGSVTFADGGGLTLIPVDAGVADSGSDSGAGVTGCSGLLFCCAGLTGALNSACRATLGANDDAACERERVSYCPPPAISGPVTGCTAGSAPDGDCDGIPDVVDESPGPPFPTTDNRTIFHQIGPGATADNSLNVGFKLDNADVYILFDATGTMEDARANLESLLTSGDVVACAQLAQCCGTNSTCQGIVASNNNTSCYTAQTTYCGSRLDCADTDLDGAPNNELRTQGVVGAIRCIVGQAWFGLGQCREVPVHKEPEQIPCLGEGCRYGDRDEQLFRHMVDMTDDVGLLRDAIANVHMNYNWDEPEGGYLALNSVVTGRGHYFGMNRPAVPDRSAAQGCAPNSFGYPCFRRNAIPIVVMFTDAPHHNGPGSSSTDATNCNGRGAGCPYSDMTALNLWNSSDSDSSSDRISRFVPAQAENAKTAYDLGDVRGRSFTLGGDTTYMKADYPASTLSCAGDDGAPDVFIRFELSAGDDADINIHLSKNDAYPDNSYGQWTPWALDPGTDDPTPATEFGAAVALFGGSPDDLSGSARLLQCHADAQPAPLRGSNWPKRKLDFSETLPAGEYYVAIKGMRTSDMGRFQLQIGEVGVRPRSAYRAPLWTDTRNAIEDSGVRVIPVVATGGATGNFITTAEAQAKLLATASGAVRSDGTPIWYRINRDGSATGQAIVTGIAELARYLSMNVSVSALDGPDSASAFQIGITPLNSIGCLQPHPLLDSGGACTGTTSGYRCDTQYNCRPGAVPKFRVTFTNPAGAPVPPNPDDPNGGYMFKLQLKGQGQYLLAEVPVYLIPSSVTAAPPPALFSPSGTYEQTIHASDCNRESDSNLLPTWDDLYFNADLPAETSIDFELCTAQTEAQLAACSWSAGGSTRKKVTVTAHGACAGDADCVDISGYGTGACAADRLCRFINPAKIYSTLRCADSSVCPNGPLGAGDYVIHSYCETRPTAYGSGRCVGSSQPVDIGSTLIAGEDGKFFSKLHLTMHADPTQLKAPVLYDWYVTYSCHSDL